MSASTPSTPNPLPLTGPQSLVGSFVDRRARLPSNEGALYKHGKLDPLLRVTATVALGVLSFSATYLGCYFAVTQAIVPLTGIAGGAFVVISTMTWIALSSCIRQKKALQQTEVINKKLFSEKADPLEIFEETLRAVSSLETLETAQIVLDSIKNVPRAKQERFELLRGFLNSLNDRYGATMPRMDAGESYDIPADGNCLFSAFQVSRDVVGSQTQTSARECRQEAVEYIKNHYPTDDKLKRYLVEGMHQHWQSPTMRHRIGEKACDERTSRMFEAELNMASGLPFFENIQDLIPLYLKEMEIDGTYGARPEIYALAHIRGCCVKIYSMDERKQISKRPVDVFNEEAFSEETCSYLYFSEKHYYTFKPNQAFLDASSEESSE